MFSSCMYMAWLFLRINISGVSLPSLSTSNKNNTLNLKKYFFAESSVFVQILHSNLALSLTLNETDHEKNYEQDYE